MLTMTITGHVVIQPTSVFWRIEEIFELPIKALRIFENTRNSFQLFEIFLIASIDDLSARIYYCTKPSLPYGITQSQPLAKRITL